MEKKVAVTKQSLRQLSKNELINIIFGLMRKIEALQPEDNKDVEVKENKE